MTIKKFKEKVYLTDQLITESYIIDSDSNVIEQEKVEKERNEIIPTEKIVEIVQKRAPTKWQEFNSRRTKEIKETHPTMLPAARKLLVSEEWKNLKLEKEKI